MVNHKEKKYFLVGIKGSGMSALAQFLSDCGEFVCGSDVEKQYFTEKNLHEKEIKIYNFDTAHLKEEYIYIISPAFDISNNTQVKAIIKSKYDYYYYHDFLGSIINKYSSIAVSGTHGKTTTTKLISHILSGHHKCNYIIGDGSGFGNIDSNVLVFEACEYKNHFLKYFPKYGVILNIDYDHPDFFLNIRDTIKSYEKFGENCKEKLIVYGDDKNIKTLINNRNKDKIITYGFSKENHVYASNIVKNKDFTTFEVFVECESYMTIKVKMYGEHMIKNILAAICTAKIYNIKAEIIKEQLSTFQMPKRRFQIIKEIGSQIIIDDYGHHPTEIKATREAIMQLYPSKSIVCIFQPHTVSRTKAFFNEFIEELNDFDNVYLTQIFYSAREKKGEITSERMVQKISKAQMIDKSTILHLKRHTDSVLLFIGAGTINELIEKYIKCV